jgi:hypothetical protein
LNFSCNKELLCINHTPTPHTIKSKHSKDQCYCCHLFWWKIKPKKKVFFKLKNIPYYLKLFEFCFEKSKIIFYLIYYFNFILILFFWTFLFFFVLMFWCFEVMTWQCESESESESESGEVVVITWHQKPNERIFFLIYCFLLFLFSFFFTFSSLPFLLSFLNTTHLC